MSVLAPNQDRNKYKSWPQIEFEGRKYTFSIVRVTPEAAMKLLETQVVNRNISKPSLSLLESRITSGEFMVTGETVILDEDGLLLDGQHRLRAIVEAGISAPIVFISGVERRAYMHIDSGGKRTTGTMLTVSGVHNGTGVAACCNVITLLSSGWKSASAYVPLSAESIQQMLAEEEFIEEAVKSVGSWLGSSGNSRKGVSHGVISGVYVVCRPAHRILVDDLLHRICTGTDLKNGTTAFKMRSLIYKGTRSATARRELAAALVNGVKRVLAGDINSNVTPKGTVGDKFPELPKGAWHL